MRFEVDPVRQIVLQRREGTDDEVFAPNPTEALGRFLVDLHVQLLIPEPVGLYATGVVGVGLLVLLVTEVVGAPAVLPGGFSGPLASWRRRLLRDLHTVTGVAVPYGAVLAFTGAFFSFGDAVVLPALASLRLTSTRAPVSPKWATPRKPTSASGARREAVRPGSLATG